MRLVKDEDFENGNDEQESHQIPKLTEEDIETTMKDFEKFMEAHEKPEDFIKERLERFEKATRHLQRIQKRPYNPVDMFEVLSVLAELSLVVDMDS